ncbi:hypothetical protein A2331_03550 [Candidatus Falkowbacteria bacterium RIFOXYB2_FULL_34_18]|uniref:Histidine kinase n=1 Tax=Candidatus Falkowbacteria bacterium RIFOXYD2_FULL_34_120 TaxID=1798007 RepID=A0A1F5TSR5_9BACT|nr:MAG: hypothetical protein A2331_03550 [Candidatus Falkowbacteria bacterium RIFOXYB2_FULL_34_18]OGF30103.1 MAG: hypothetical protein A2500_04900 [Candidatus Falkowbacteria bacterium RIFOXYC12_FULL_34_55]OGF37563.1 MAG: hypothetical protein A2466_01945 [Candidatus Falkowbacteria bacterium RIFOXYC2_FULL_34_220]OGF39319.1 MAG: hypothetical protein A2515_02360 [Candidatus Falkowbacteria bacterium RIFOXYD12_FULL_34_57]OGF41824.1 MAG: hypothetical protein A2531_05345 [Candidatus Falkowbacteria bact
MINTKNIKGQRILIVEDEAIVANDIKNTLEKLNYSVDGILDTGEDVLNIIKEKKLDLILMDVKLKGKIDGIETAKRIKEFNIPIIYLTAYSDKKTIERAKETMPYGFLLKPFDNQELNSVIQMAIYKHEAEKRLKESEEKYRYLLDHIEEFVLIVDQSGKILFANKSALQVVGRTEGEMVGKPISDFLSKESLLLAIEAIKSEFAGKTIDLEEVEVVNKSGEIRNLKLDPGSKFVKEEGKIIGMLISGLDITEQKKINKEIEQQNIALEKANKLMVGRELKMIELKNKIKELENKLK